MILYFAVLFLITWGLWFAADAIGTAVPGRVLFYLGVFMPGILAIAFTHREQGARGVRALLARLVKLDVGAQWFAFALFFIASVKLLVALIVRIGTGAWPAFGSESVPLMFGAAIAFTLLGGQVGEELGWRGYALPRLARPLGPGAASILIGIIWAAWHLPLFFILGADTNGQSFPYYLLQVIALSVAIVWLYMKTTGSLLLTMLFHAAINNTKDIVPSALPDPGNPWLLRASAVGWITLSILWLCAVWFLFDMRRKTSVARFTEAA